jgi:hypothetical protein
MKYSLKTEYRINATPDIVWNTLSDVEALTSASKYFREVRLRGEDRMLVQNAIIDFSVRAVLPYTLRFSTEIIELVPCRKIRVVSSGDLVGEGKLTLDHESGNTFSTFVWEVEAINRLTRAIACMPFGDRLLRHPHDCVMENGYRSLAALVEIRKGY